MVRRIIKRKYMINIKNKNGSFNSRTFKTRKNALSVMRNNKKADKIINSGGYRSKSGSLIRIRNKYSIKRK